MFLFQSENISITCPSPVNISEKQKNNVNIEDQSHAHKVTECHVHDRHVSYIIKYVYVLRAETFSHNTCSLTWYIFGRFSAYYSAFI